MDRPPFPWRLRPRGVAVATAQLVAIERVRSLVPPAFPILPVWPGHTLGGLFLAEYGPGSVVEYDELVVCAAVVLHGARPCAWVTHVYVDAEASLRGGREGIGAPKRMARFIRSEVGTTVVDDRGDVVCTLRHGRLFRLWRQRIRFRAAHLDVRSGDGSRASIHGNQISGRLHLGGAAVEIPSGSPLHPLGLGRALVAVGLGDADALFGGAANFPVRAVATEW